MGKYKHSKYEGYREEQLTNTANEAAEQNRLTRIYLQMFAEEFANREYIEAIRRDDA